jgi:hypothetical protein
LRFVVVEQSALQTLSIIGCFSLETEKELSLNNYIFGIS